MSLEDRQADAVGSLEESIRVCRSADLKHKIQERLNQLNDAFAEAYELDDEDDGDRAYDAVADLEEYAADIAHLANSMKWAEQS